MKFWHSSLSIQVGIGSLFQWVLFFPLLQLDDLRALVAQQLGLTLQSSDLHRLRLLKKGNVLDSEVDIAELDDGG